MTRILVIDDHEMVRRGLRAMLNAVRPEWQICGEAANGREAVELALQLRPDVVVIDLAMPELNGLEAARQIRRELRQTEVLVFAHYASEQLARDIAAAGARGFVLKADPVQQLVAAIEALSRHRPFFTPNINDQILDLLIAGCRQPGEGTGKRVGALTPREREIVQLLAEGKSNKEVASRLFLSVKTVETHRGAIMRKLDVNSIVGLVHYALRNQIVDIDGWAGLRPAFPSSPGGFPGAPGVSRHAPLAQAG